MCVVKDDVTTNVTSSVISAEENDCCYHCWELLLYQELYSVFFKSLNNENAKYLRLVWFK